MKTYRQIMEKTGGNLSWCKPILLEKDSQSLIIEVNEGDLVGKVDLTDIENVFAVPALDNISDLYNYNDYNSIKATELDCRDCPSFKICPAMNENTENE